MFIRKSFNGKWKTDKYFAEGENKKGSDVMKRSH